MVNNRKIETLGVSYLRTFIDKNDYLQTYFDENDKTPLWDGEIHVLKEPSERKSDILGKVPVQIKATTKNKEKLQSFLLSLNDLKLYSKNGGLVLFVVWIDEKNELKEIYYKSLPPLSIKNLIRKSKKTLKNRKTNRQTVSIPIYPLAENDVYSMLVGFINESRRQYSFATSGGLTISDIPKDKTLKFYYYGKSPSEVFDYQEEHELFTYLEDPNNGIEIPIENPIRIVETAEETDIVFSIGGYDFDKVIRHRFPSGKVELHIDSGFTISINEKTKQFSLNYLRPDNLFQAIKCTKALQELQNIGFIKMNDEQIYFDEQSLSKISSMNLNQHLDELLQIYSFMEKLGIEKEINLSLFDKQSQQNLYFLNKGLVLKDEVPSNYEESKLLHLRIANVHFLTLYSFIKIGSGKLVDIFSETPLCKKVEGEDTEYISIFEIFDPNDWLKVDNCNFDSVITSYKQIVDMNASYDGANETIIKIISAADLSKDENRKKVLLGWAQKLSDWNISYFDEQREKLNNSQIQAQKRAKINDLQIKVRKRKLNDIEIEILNDIFTNSIGDSEICFGISVLLNSKPQADYYWNKLDKRIQEGYKEYPIYTLYRKL